MALDIRHIETIRRILGAVADTTTEPARGLVACEDAMVALHLGLSFGLTPKQILQQHEEVMKEAVSA